MRSIFSMFGNTGLRSSPTRMHMFRTRGAAAATAITVTGIKPGDKLMWLAYVGGLVNLNTRIAAGSSIGASSTAEAVLDSYTVPRGKSGVGTRFKVRIQAHIDAAAAGNWTFRVRIGATTLTGTVVAAGGTAAAVVDTVVVCDLDVVCRSQTSWSVSGSCSINAGAPGTIAQVAAGPVAAVAVTNDAADTLIEATGQFSSSNVGNTARVLQFSVDEIPAYGLDTFIDDSTVTLGTDAIQASTSTRGKELTGCYLDMTP